MSDLNSAIRPCAVVRVCDIDRKLLQIVFKIEKEGNELKFLPVNEKYPHDKIWLPVDGEIEEIYGKNGSNLFIKQYNQNHNWNEDNSKEHETKYISYLSWRDGESYNYDFIPIISLSALPRIEDYSFASEQDLSLVREVVGDRKDKRFLAIINERKVDGSSTLSVKTSQKLYGLFNFEENLAKPNTQNPFVTGTKIFNINYTEIAENPHLVKDIESGQEYISKLKDFKKDLDLSSVKYSDKKYVSDLELLSFWAKDLKNPDGKKTVLSKNEAKTLLAALRAFNEAKPNILDDESYSRLKNILENYINSDDNYKSKIKPLIEDFISQNKDFMDGSVQQVNNEVLEDQINKYKDSCNLLEKERNDLKQKIEELKRDNAELKKVSGDIDKLREQARKEQENIEKKKQEFEKLEEKLNQQNFEKLEKEQQEKVSNLTLELKKKENELKKYTDLVNRYRELDDIIKEREYLTRNVDEQKQNLKALETEYDDLKKNFRSEAMKFDEIYNFFKRKDYADIKENPIKEISLYREFSLHILLKYLQKQFANKRYDISSFDIVNILVCLVNNRFVIFSGSPGTGKTSTATMLADFLNLSSNSLFKKVSVARGWSSSRDFIGYYNPINNQFESAKTGIYEFLSAKYSEDDILQLILLDEANLSPIEHYWSDFLDTVDNESSYIPLGNNQAISIKKGCKFIGTINSDHSTEVLTPRLLDRTPIISFSNNSDASANLVDFELVDDYSETSEEFNFSNNYVLALSNLTSLLSSDAVNIDSDSSGGDERINEFKKLINEFNKSFKGYTSISKRKSDQIKNYILSFNTVVDNLDAGDSNDLKNQVVDYAIVQFVLPLINFNCFDSKPLDDFLGYLKNSGIYERSISVLEDIIAKGKDNLGHYSFF
ncbi:ATP-binding protein [Francisella tularensis]|uniref:ATP-binding protein n=1 Tax=Francisella tularensis TaxID=263 RepID=UPI0001855334|nr:ATP-binding protein [Francisella tularensis]EDZ89999.1 seven Residue Repeat family protein [Francisella tularensis subsp. novicida FTG]MBK2334927.1 hypothetical protein [Francisella tularensis subsp. novicida]